ncbi:PTS glucose transporter subunit IIA [Bacillus sp. FJAT-27225]|uniref:PTS sugar transporter subunit IIA n=1 Tax=Bacillus sp. FJAT-27225 TaxID=1743144 RepID=UPI00080C2442|nr:PTS glucose transporter subunit IIA [Bacillus sp. FJAT-27225]OCA90831.1 PTS glucose transporter subunit IIA [Bacillus sp. FJAT-27225]
MFKNLFGKKQEVVTEVELVSPLTGTAAALESVDDPVFSQKMMGDGLAVQPAEGTVVAPVDGEIVQVFPTGHAVGIKAANGAEILIHIGLETVSMKGEGFTAHVHEGDKVKKGDKLVSFDMSLVTERAKSTVTPLIITNTDAMTIEQLATGEVEAGVTPFLKVTSK